MKNRSAHIFTPRPGRAEMTNIKIQQCTERPQLVCDVHIQEIQIKFESMQKLEIDEKDPINLILQRHI